MENCNLYDEFTITEEVLNLLDSSDDNYVKNQKARIKLSIKVCKNFNVIQKKVLNVAGGNWGPIVEAWQKSFPDADFIPTDTDLHCKFPYKDNSFDSVLCCEIFEHIGDRNFMSSCKNFEGVINLMSEIIRVMKPHAKMLLTTPNITSYYNIALSLRSTHPFMYPLHYREYSPYEMKTIMDFFKVNTLLFDTYNVFSKPNDFNNEIENFCIDHNLPTQNRGDDFFIVIEKPENYIAPVIPENTAFILYNNMKREKIISV